MSNELTTNVSWQAMKSQAVDLVRSGMLPAAIKKPEQALVIMQKGAELGIPPMQAFSHIHVISGKPTMSAELMMSMILTKCPEAKINILKYNNEAVSYEASRPNWKPVIFEFTIEDAKLAGLLSNPTWKKYPRAMLRSRCVSEMARAMFADCLSGVSYTAEELGAPVNEEGEVIDVDSIPTIDTIYTGSDHQKQFLKDALVEAQVPVEQWAQVSKLVREAEVACGDIPTALVSILKSDIPDSMLIGHEETEGVTT